MLRIILIISILIYSGICLAQIAPTPSQIASYKDLHRAAQDNNSNQIVALVAAGSNVDKRDNQGRTPVHVAAFASSYDALRALVKAGADINALENQAYDAVTIAAVAKNFEMVDLALKLGGRADLITSPYIGTALIASSHLGHYKIVQRLIDAGAPLDHVNNLNWTALIEAVVLGDGGPDHQATIKALVDAGANRSIGDAADVTPLQHAISLGYTEIIALLK